MRKNKFQSKFASQAYTRKTQVNIWPTKNLTYKQKKAFSFRTKTFSSEFGFQMKKKELANLFNLKQNMVQYNQQKSAISKKSFSNANFNKQNKKGTFKLNIPNLVVNKNASVGAQSIFFKKSFWFLKKTSLIPGGTRMVRTKSFNLVKANSLKTLKTFLKSMSFAKMLKLVSITNNQVGFNNTLKFVHAIESLPIVLVQKSFQYNTSSMTQPILKQKVYVNSKKHLALPYKQMKPGDMFLNKSVNKSFYKYTK